MRTTIVSTALNICIMSILGKRTFWLSALPYLPDILLQSIEVLRSICHLGLLRLGVPAWS